MALATTDEVLIALTEANEGCKEGQYFIEIVNSKKCKLGYKNLKGKIVTISDIQWNAHVLRELNSATSLNERF